MIMIFRALAIKILTNVRDIGIYPPRLFEQLLALGIGKAERAAVELHRLQHTPTDID